MEEKTSNKIPSKMSFKKIAKTIGEIVAYSALAFFIIFIVFI